MVAEAKLDNLMVAEAKGVKLIVAGDERGKFMAEAEGGS